MRTRFVLNKSVSVYQLLSLSVVYFLRELVRWWKRLNKKLLWSSKPDSPLRSITWCICKCETCSGWIYTNSLLLVKINLQTAFDLLYVCSGCGHQSQPPTRTDAASALHEELHPTGCMWGKRAAAHEPGPPCWPVHLLPHHTHQNRTSMVMTHTCLSLLSDRSFSQNDEFFFRKGFFNDPLDSLF